MDKPHEEMQELGFFGIYKESFKTILSWKKIFSQVTLTYVLPMSFIFLVHFFIVEAIDWRIERDENRLYKYSLNEHLYRKLSSDWVWFWVFKVIYLTCLLVSSLLATAAIVYTIADLYSGSEVTFNKVWKIVPKVWKRLVLTFFVYNVVASLVLFVWATTTMRGTKSSNVVFYILVAICYVGFIYITALWQVASVVTVLESSCGLQAIIKSNALIKGKRWLSWFVFFALYCIFMGILVLFFAFARFGFFGVVVGIACGFLLMNLFLVGYVAQTMLYLVCKSYLVNQSISWGCQVSLEAIWESSNRGLRWKRIFNLCILKFKFDGF